MSDEVVVDVVNLTQPEVAEIPQAVIQLGAELLAARKAKGFTQQDVSNTLRLSLKQIEALESNDFAALPDAMITRGFIRNYARLLGLDAEPLLASYKAQVPDKQPNALSVQSSMHQVVSSKKRQPWLLYSLLGVLLGCLIAWFLFMSYLPKFAKPVAEKTREVALSPAPTTSAVVPLPELALPAAERQVLAEDVPVVTSPDAAVKESDTNIVSEVKPSTGLATIPSVENRNSANLKSTPPPSTTAVDLSASKANSAHVADQSSQVSPAQLQATKTLAIASSVTDIKANSTVASPIASVKTNAAIVAPKKVNISATGRSWVSITDKSGKVVFEKMLTAGSEESFEVVVPMNVVIGNVQVTKLAFSGKPVDLAVAAKSNVAHLVLE